MQHIHITDPSGCTILNLDSSAARQAPPAQAARQCTQCQLPTWRLTPVCIHCGHDRYARLKLAAKTTAYISAAVVVIFHPLVTARI